MGKVSNFKLQVCNLNFGQTIGGLKSYDTSVPPGSFLSYIYIYIYILVFLKERDIKVELTEVCYGTLTELTLSG